ncbi:bifunctional DNA-formamidopyrimidine glycosylase/DNA-(apurinic or apyrimidinic site) lyase [Ornithinimicrobium ciconiae]|uniref:Formamidopyrimidine-DNA glycosylase n=1 Tax=Ornithinimicrobium ciconiae TaxID=2594265 RepID=A0A516GCR8_9MICO|nr:bifunctional DNA-formamidopyrimidine glycosylase/DNA-(apurinic or apyrimidinic site) lyase [Ornithinimicrobium ciconiae]QDO89160.1 bifunctional DNA-formamidopyrimidine glycosylase/DNA-(apurinic or apyrimidinic site) lyase [Ornithinimicrobium ciconiae]
MPELPEVEVVRRGLADHVVGRRIEAATITGTRVARRHDAGPADLAARLAGVDVLAADRRGKYLWLVVQAPGDDPHALVVHLGMSGQLLVEASDAPREKHLHASFDFADGGPQLRFVDQRTFGGLALTELIPDPYAGSHLTQTLHPPTPHAPTHHPPTPHASTHHLHGVPLPVGHIAPDPLEPVYDQRAVVRELKGRHTAIKRALLDQGRVSGIGNIYADEALWRAHVNPLRDTSVLTKPTIARVLDHAAAVMREALGQGGTSFDALYVNVNGASGYFDRSLHAYGREGEPCDRCGTPIRRESFMNRSSHYCPRCQPRPRVARAS